MIYDGAGIAYTPEVLLSEWGISVKNQKKSFEKNKLGLASDLKLLYSCLDLRPKSLDDLIRRTGLPPEKDIQSSSGIGAYGTCPGKGQTIYKSRTVQIPEGIYAGMRIKARRGNMAKYLVIVESPAKVKP